MKMLNMKRCLNVVLMILILAGLANAGGQNRAGTNAAPELLIPVGARDLAMGGASVATTSGIDALFWNPAGLARGSSATSTMFSHMNYIADINVNYFAVSTTFGSFGTLGFSLKSLNIGEIGVTTEDFPDGTGEIISPTYVTLGTTYSKLLAENISVGATINVISERIDRVSASGFGINAGVQYSNLGGIDGLNLGVAVKNIGPQMKFDGSALLHQTVVDGQVKFVKIDAGSYELPSTIEIGASYSTKFSGDNNLTFVSLFQNNNFNADEYKVGAEYSYHDNFFVRGGWNFAESQTDESLPANVERTNYIYSGTAGVGVKYTLSDLDVSVDYAYRAVKYLDGNHTITLKLGF